MPTKAMAVALLIEAYYQILRRDAPPGEDPLPDTAAYRRAFAGLFRDETGMVLSDIRACLGEAAPPWATAHLN